MTRNEKEAFIWAFILAFDPETRTGITDSNQRLAESIIEMNGPGWQLFKAGIAFVYSQASAGWRQAFETWAKTQHHDLRNADADTYFVPTTQTASEGFQAGVAHAQSQPSGEASSPSGWKRQFEQQLARTRRLEEELQAACTALRDQRTGESANTELSHLRRENRALRHSVYNMRKTLRQYDLSAQLRKKPQVSDATERLQSHLIELIQEYGNECAVQAYHGKLCCKRKPEDIFAEIQSVLSELIKGATYGTTPHST